jgi:molybdopterin synthase sulfur carrier subunit
MSIKVLYFASLRETLGVAVEELALPPGVTTLAGLRDHIVARGEPWAQLARTKNLRCAINRSMAGFDATIGPNDEVAFFPPVTGG